MRAVGIAEGLSRRHAVTVATNAGLTLTGARFSVVPYSRRAVITEARRADAVIGPWLPPYLMPIAMRAGARLVSDLYDPVEFELPGNTAGADADELARVERLTQLQLRFADLVVCGSETQRARLEERHGDLLPPVCTIRFGLPSPPPRTTRRPIRERLGTAAEAAFVVLWWGSPWRWLDVHTAIRGVARLDAASRVRLVVTAGRPSSPEARARLDTESARALASELGVLGSRVFFVDEWVAFEDRHEWLADADAGITIHGNQAEAELAVRARYLDYLWSSLPPILSEGDELSKQFAEAGFAQLVPAGDPDAVATALGAWEADPGRRERAVAAGRRLADAMRWETVVSPLADELSEAPTDSRSKSKTLRLGAAVLSYYAYISRQKLSHRVRGT